MVPVVGAEDGRWLLPGRLAPAMKPGGHGAIWKLMLDQGIFDWLAHHGREAAVVRQIRCVASARYAGRYCCFIWVLVAKLNLGPKYEYVRDEGPCDRLQKS